MQKPRLIAGLVFVTVLLFAGIARAALPPGGTFIDDDGNTFEGAVELSLLKASPGAAIRREHDVLSG